MLMDCVVCGKTFNKKNDKGHRFVPDVCSGKCFLKLLTKFTFDDNLSLLDLKEEVGDKMIELKNCSFSVHEDDMRSHYELRFKKWLKKNCIGYKYEPYMFRLSDGSCYIPDFIIPIVNTVIEIKGIWQGRAYTKYSMFVEEFNIRTFLINNDALKRIQL